MADLMCRVVIHCGFLQCRVGVGLVAYYAKHTSMESYNTKEWQQGQVHDFNMSLQSRAFSRTVMDKKSLSRLVPVSERAMVTKLTDALQDEQKDRVG